MGAKNLTEMKLLSFFTAIPLLTGQETIGLTIGAPEIPVAQPIIPEATETSEVAEMTIDDNDVVEEVVEEANDSTTLPNIESIPVSESTSTFAPPVPEEIFPTSVEVSTKLETGVSLDQMGSVAKQMSCIQTCMSGSATEAPTPTPCPEITMHSCPEPEPCPTIECPPPPSTTTSTTTLETTTKAVEIAETKFQVKVTTTNSFYAGTDDKVYISIHGETGQSGMIELDNDDSISATLNGEPSQIQLFKGGSDRWQVSEVGLHFENQAGNSTNLSFDCGDVKIEESNPVISCKLN